MKQIIKNKKLMLIILALLVVLYYLNSRLLFAANDLSLPETDNNKDGLMTKTGKMFDVKNGQYVGFITGKKLDSSGKEGYMVRRGSSWFLISTSSENFKKGIL